MTTTGQEVAVLEQSFNDALPDLVASFQPAAPSNPQLVILNEPLAAKLGLDADVLREPRGVAFLSGASVLDGTTPVAMAYAGHQFGNYSPRLGDGRAVLLGELVSPDGGRSDLHLKGSGRTPFARGGDGKAALGPMLREYLISEAMFALDIPTTRSLSVVSTGEPVLRGEALPGAVLARTASSHLRVGTFEFAARRDLSLLQNLADYAIERHFPEAADSPTPYLAFLKAVIAAQADLIQRWISVGFIHGVMNTDNMTISGETIDYGPCAFIDQYDPKTVFSSIDHQGRYAFGNQPQVAQWNLARLAETLLPLISEVSEEAVAAATEALEEFGAEFQRRFDSTLATKLGLLPPTASSDELRDEDVAVVNRFLNLIVQPTETGALVDYTGIFRDLADWLRQADRGEPPANSIAGFEAWAQNWLVLIDERSDDVVAVADTMDRLNPIYIPRNHLVEEALDAATEGNVQPFNDLLAAVSNPFTAREGFDRYAEPAPTSFTSDYQTFCGT